MLRRLISLILTYLKPEVTTFWGRLMRARTYLQTEYEQYHTDGGIRINDFNYKEISRHSDWLVQSDKIRGLYDFKSLVDVSEWLTK